LYLFLLYTVGILGLLAYLVFFTALLHRWWRDRNIVNDNPLLSGMPKLAIVLMAVFFVSQLRIEFLRDLLHDYQTYVYALWAMFLAFSDNLRDERLPIANQTEVRSGRILAPKRALAQRSDSHVLSRKAK
jgi:hypothetical protein